MIMAIVYTYQYSLPVFYSDTSVGIRSKMITNINALTLGIGINIDYT